MPEMYFRVRWPDGREERCYSPSLVIKELLDLGKPYPVFEFTERSRAALRIAAERVKMKYGFYCSAAMDQLATIEAGAQSYEASALVEVLAFEDKA
jgi:uncharacterized repeat protein (TIGR04042 family)